MIPTTLSASPSSSSSIGNAGGCATNSPNNLSNTTTKELVVGIASLILEGRAFVDDEYSIVSMRQATPSPPRGPNLHSEHSQVLSMISSSGRDGGGGTIAVTHAGRQSPKPSTSKTATCAQHLINITTNPHHAFGASTAPLFIETPAAYHSSSSAASSAESTHQRWTQKLCQLRQASPAASLTAPYEQKIALEAAQINPGGSNPGAGGEPELVSLAIHGSNVTAERGASSSDFEIVRRVMLSRSILPIGTTAAGSSSLGACGSASSSPNSSSDNFLHSLQSLATTCLRGSSPSMDTPTSGCHYSGTTPSSGYASMVSPKYATYRASTPRFHSPLTYNLDLQPGSASSCGSGVQSPKMTSSCHSRVKNFSMLRQGGKTGRICIPTSTVTSCSTASTVPNLAATKTPSSTLSETTPKASYSSLSCSSTSYPQQGPHCDQFLRKMGLTKGEAAEAEDHYCDMSYVNITCSRWRAYCLKMDAIIERSEPICIEVYLGPVGHKVLLEQWIFTFKEKLPPPTMTLPSLCSAIRSQLYFSQISAWYDLIQKCDKSIYDTGRVIFANSSMMGCAGDLATSTPTLAGLSCTPSNTATCAVGPTANTTPLVNSPSTSTSIDQITNAMLNQRPRLNLFYRVKQYDATACFNSKPAIHNFPNVNISENCSISVCLKSLPRINGGIPKLGTMMSIPNENPTANIGRNPLGENSSNKILIDEMSLSKEKQTVPTCSNGGAASKGTNNKSGNVSINSASNGSDAFSNCDKSKMNATGDGIIDDNNLAKNHKIQLNRFGKNCQLMLSKKDAEIPCSSSSLGHNEPIQKCTFFIDECELSIDRDTAGEADADGDADDISDFGNDAQCSNGSCGSMSHREKQLLKYRKRMLKRDKKQQNQQQKNPYSSSSAMSSLSSSLSAHQPMEQGDDDENGSEQSSTGLLTVRHVTKMISTGTQTPELVCCQRCGNDKSLVCLRCNDGSYAEENRHEDYTMGIDEMDACSVNSLSSAEIISTPRSKGDLLLQAIQRTPKAAKHKQKAQRSTGIGGDSSSTTIVAKQRSTVTSNVTFQNNNQINHLNNSTNETGVENGVTPSSSNSSLASLASGCQVCKRQKTQHNFGFDNGVANNGISTLSVIESGKCDSAAVNDVDGEDDEHEGGSALSALSNAIENNGQEEMNKTPSKTTVALPRSCNSIEIMDEECFVSSTKLTPHFDRCALSSVQSAHLITPTISVPFGKSGNHALCQSRHAATSTKRSFTPPTPLRLNVECEFKTPNVGADSAMLFQHKVTSKPNLLEVVCNYGTQNELKVCCGGSGCSNGSVGKQDYHSSLIMRKGLPKVNLTPIFCNSSSGNSFGGDIGGIGGNQSGCCESPSPDSTAFSFDSVTINRVKFERAAAAAVPSARNIPTAYNNNNSNSNSNSNSNNNNNNNNNNNTANNNNINCNRNNNNTAIAFDNNAVPVQKSYSAPTLPNSPSLSPRFAKQASIYKRRSRHLSDRSDRSSLGSDEQYSDEDLDCPGGMLLTPGTLYNGNVRGGTASPMKQRARLAGMFNRQPLLGNLEECLLQNRIMPKTEVNGFKVLLGASGGFCPTQLTIPAAAYFYELHGETLSTPYVCEIRLPRKGYSVPRTGTIQATLLNPLGTVVRMFVIPYDMRDMPPLHQTFIRQRILADSSALSPSTSVGATTVSQSNSSNNESNNLDFAQINMECVGDGSNSNVGGENAADGQVKKLGHFISSEHMKRLRYSIHLRFQTSRSGRLLLHTDIRLLISRRTDCDTAAAHAKGLLEAPNELIIDTVMPSNPKYSVRQDISSNGAGNNRI